MEFIHEKNAVSVKEQEFTCSRDGLCIWGKSWIPEGTNLPAIVISHGFGGNRSEAEPYYPALTSLGYAVYCFDFCGGSIPGTGRSDGAVEEMTIRTEMDDLIAVMEYVKAQPFIHAERLTLMGFSQGGFVSALVAGERSQEVERLILFFPALCIPDHARRGRLGGGSYDVNNVPEIIDCGKMKLGRAFYDGVESMDPFLEISRYKGPVLLMHGTKDVVVDVSYAIRAKAEYGDTCSLQLFRGAGHGFDPSHTEASIASIRQFLSGGRELFSVTVFITGSELAEGTEHQGVRNVFFTGYCDSENFRGSILPGAVDRQILEDGKGPVLHADYTLEGLDCAGKTCRIHIQNRCIQGEWKPTLDTDSEALGWLKEADITAGMEFFENGLNVRIFTRN